MQMLVTMQGHVFAVELNVLPLEDYELVLGTQWLRTLGVIQWDFMAVFMKFHQFKTTVTLVGLHLTDLTLQEGKQFFKKLVRKGILLHILSLGFVTSSPQPCDPTNEQLLIEFASVCATSTSLPPYRGHEHYILLKKGTTLICQRLYRYPYFQKTEIEKIVT